MREAIVNYGIGIEIKIRNLIDSTNIENFDSIFCEIRNYYLNIDFHDEISDSLFESYDKKIDHKTKLEQLKYIFFKHMEEKIIIFRYNICIEDVLRMGTHRKMFLFEKDDKEIQTYFETLEQKIKELQLRHASPKIFLLLNHSY